MCTFTFVVVERVGRRKGLIWGAALGCIPMWYIGGGYLAMVCVYINAFIICATWQGITVSAGERPQA
jgi:MFS family permease